MIDEGLYVDEFLYVDWDDDPYEEDYPDEFFSPGDWWVAW